MPAAMEAAAAMEVTGPAAPAIPAAPGHWNVLPERSMSRMRVSMGVLPTSLTKKSCSMTEEETVLREGSRKSSLPKRVG